MSDVTGCDTRRDIATASTPAMNSAPIEIATAVRSLRQTGARKSDSGATDADHPHEIAIHAERGRGCEVVFATSVAQAHLRRAIVLCRRDLNFGQVLGEGRGERIARVRQLRQRALAAGTGMRDEALCRGAPAAGRRRCR
jgi:hypothetical protein